MKPSEYFKGFMKDIKGDGFIHLSNLKIQQGLKELDIRFIDREEILEMIGKIDDEGNAEIKKFKDKIHRKLTGKCRKCGQEHPIDGDCIWY